MHRTGVTVAHLNVECGALTSDVLPESICLLPPQRRQVGILQACCNQSTGRVCWRAMHLLLVHHTKGLPPCYLT